MSDYALLYTGGRMPETEVEQARVMQAWTGWYGTIGASLKDGGNPFAPVAKTVGSDGSIKDGASGPQHSGYTIVSAASLETAAELAKGSPILSAGGSVTVYEIVEM